MQAEILIRNPNWKEGESDSSKYFAVPIPPGEGGAEVRVNQQGYSLYFDRREERTVNLSINDKEERTVHIEMFFNERFEQPAVAIWKRYTDWTPAKIDRTIIEPSKILAAGPLRHVKPS